MSSSADLIQANTMQNPETLMQAFEQFGRLSEQLQQSYQELDQRTAALTDELAVARSERLQQLAEKEKLADRLEMLLAALPAGVVVLNKQGRVQIANTAAESFFEQTLEGEDWQKVLTQQTLRIETQDVVLKNGRVLTIDSKKLKTDSDEIVLCTDVTHTRRLQNLANRQIRLAAMGQMAAGLAHQLRTPLSSAVLYASQLNNVALQPEQQTRAVEKIRTSLRYLEKLINDMLMYAKGGEFGDETFDLNKLLFSFNARIEPRLKQHNAKLHITSKPFNVTLKGSQDALVSVLMNLAENSIQACECECLINLKVYQQTDYLIIEMCDNGPGLSADEQQRIFEPFYTQRSDGTGLGLAVAQSIVQAHQGDLLVGSHSDQGKGSIFYLCLPLTETEHFLPSGKTTLTNKPSVGQADD